MENHSKRTLAQGTKISANQPEMVWCRVFCFSWFTLVAIKSDIFISHGESACGNRPGPPEKAVYSPGVLKLKRNGPASDLEGPGEHTKCWLETF